MSNSGPIKMELPSWVTSRKLRPPEYGKLVDEVKSPDGLMSTEKVCTLLMETGLRREFLGYIWSTANRHIPGVLNEQEFCIILALVALAQKGTPVFDLSFLSQLPEPPIPVFNREHSFTQKVSRSQNPPVNQNQFNAVNVGNASNASGQEKVIEDEYSDFQKAEVAVAVTYSNSTSNSRKAKPLPNVQRNVVTPNFAFNPVSTARSFDSPLHAIANFPKQLTAPTSALHVSKSPSDTSVGSRLANYDLGLSLSTTMVTPPQSTTVLKPNENLMIGEVDKYSALRDLVANGPDESEQNVLQNGNVGFKVSLPKQGESTESDISTFDEDILQVIESEPADVSPDFGDFQSFSNQKMGNTFDSVQQEKIKNPLDVFSDASINYHNDVNSYNKSCPQLPPNHCLAVSAKAANVSDSEFGDFVSCTNGLVSTPESFHTQPTITKPAMSNGQISQETFENAFKQKSQTYQPTQPLKFKISSATNMVTAAPPPKSGSERISQKNTFQSNTQKSSVIDLLSISDLNFNRNENINFQSENDLDMCDIKMELNGTLKTTSIHYGDFFDCDSVESIHQMNLDAIISTQDFDCVHPGSGKSKVSEISPETRSLASLDFGNYSTTWDLSDTAKPSVETPVSLTVDSKSFKTDLNSPAVGSSSPSLTSRLFSNNGGGPHCSQSIDKYQCFKEEIENETERYSFEWIRCMKCCLQIISHAMNVFNSASSSAVIRDVVCNENGQSYILNLIEVYLVASRIHRSWLKLGGDSNVGAIHQEIVEAWDSLTPFLLGTPLMEDITSAEEWLDGEYSDYSKVCGVCLINTKKDDPNALLDYGGKHYHATCANLWINGVDSILPSLSYVSLL